MAKICIDTNVFLDLYQAATDRLGVFRELVARAESVVLPQQIVEEFQRNRIVRLRTLVKAVRSRGKAAVWTTAAIRELDAYAEWDCACKSFKKKAGEIAQELESWIADESTDPVAIEFRSLVQKATVIMTKDVVVRRAQDRRLLGRPPTSPGKHSIGDEVIWETLIEGCSDDLVIVSRDSGFLDHGPMLKEEYEQRTGSLLMAVTSDLSEGLLVVGAMSALVQQQEEAIREARGCSGSKCPYCDVDMQWTGFEGSGGDDCGWLWCPQCGHEIMPS